MATTFSEAARAAPSGISLATDHRLYRHTKRENWGVAILAWEDGDVRAYQFEDGRLRKLKKGYFKLMKPVKDKDLRGSRETLVRNLTAAVEGKTQRDPDAEELTPVAPFSAQVELFLELYPEGFQDPAWASRYRSTPDGSALKRHRDPVVRAVAEGLSAERCAELMEDGQYGTVVTTVEEILSSTNLVSLRHARLLRGLDADEEKALAETVVDLLHGDEEYRTRFDAYLKVLERIVGSRPSWRFATALPALAFPQAHVCVRASAFKRQAGSISPKSRYTQRAQAGPYESYRQVAFAVRKRLESAGHTPRDLLDVHDFVWTTLRNSALEHLTD